MKKLIDSKQYKEALDLFDQQTEICNNFTIDMAIKACTILNDYKRGITIQQKLSSNSLNNPYIQTSLIHFYSLMSNNMPKKVLDLFNEMTIEPDNFTLTILFHVCGELANDQAMKIGKKLLHEMPNNYKNNNFVSNSAIHMLMKFGDVQGAERVFHSIKKKDIITYNVMIKGYIRNTMSEKALDLFEQIHLNLDSVTYTIVFDACAQLANDRAKRIGKKLLHEMSNDCRNDIVLTSATHMLMKFGETQNAERVFHSIKKKDIITYGAMMKGYIENEMSEKVLDLFEKIHLKLDTVTYTIVFNACSQLANDRAKKIGKKLFDEMPDNYRNDNVVLTSATHMLMKFGEAESAERVIKLMRNKDVITYGALMNGYNMNGEPWKCFEVWEEMKQRDIVLNEIIWTILIGACSKIGMIRQSQYILHQVPLHIQNQKQVQNSVIHMWGKCGSVEKARNVYESVDDRDTLVFEVNGFGLNGMGSEAIKLYREMPNNLRNEVTHICVLNACSHSGFLHEAQNIYNVISFKTEKIVTVMIDCFSRLFLFDEAQKLIDEYEKKNSPNFVMYMCLLSGVRNNRNNNLSKKIYNRMKSLFPDAKQGLVSGTILLANIYSSVGEHQLAKNFRYNQIKELRSKVKMGLSWTYVNGEIVQFKAHDHSHPRSSEIYAELDRLTVELNEHGYKFDSSWITRPLREEETIESVLCGHSEKLAIAYNLIQRPLPDFIQVTKNLRVCGDCHEATKFIAKIRQIDIIVRDANRIHHFHKNGQCSCQDHF
ncbi:unnamed protein product [Rotaria sordida]|uniref:Pentatricopeptide repeat-containing protein n=1 Tax=Rotaria sordida TaxID=392033 RepID=A0A818RCZ9_9BILA|nr:unnamed protein product [Rotaria sordida]